MPTSSNVAAIGACGLWIVTRTDRTRGKCREHGVGDPAGGGLDQTETLSAERVARAVDDLVIGDGIHDFVRPGRSGKIDLEVEVDT